MPLDMDRYLDDLDRDGRAFLELAPLALDQPVDHCPGWDGAALASHLGRVWHSMAMHVSRRATEMIPADEVPRPPSGDALIDWLDDAFGAVTAALAGAGPDERVWTWTAENTTGFYRRRMAQETSMHLWDLRTAAHRSEPLEPELAADGIDELFDVLLPEVVTRGVPQPTGSLHLHRTDGDGEWSVELVDGALVASHEHTKGDAAVRGSAGDLLLMMWERAAVDDESLQVFGDTDVVKSWTSLSR